MFQYSIGITSLNLNQFGMDSISHNIANANTPGFHRRQLLTASLPEYQINGRLVGGGVGLGQYRQVRDMMLESSLSRSIGDLSAIQQQVRTDGRIESMMGLGSGSMEELFSQFQSTLGQLSTDPANSTQRRLVLDTATRLSSQIRQTSVGLGQLKADIDRQIQSDVASLNGKMVELSDLQKRLNVSGATTGRGELVDRRDQLINEIAELIDVDRNELSRGGLGLVLGGGSVSIGSEPMTVSAIKNGNGDLELRIDQFSVPVRPRGGRLAASLESYNSTIDAFQDRLGQLTSGLIRTVDQAHARGVGPSGSFVQLASIRSLSSTVQPLAQSGLAFPVTAGELFFNVTDASGKTRTSSISYDPATESLSDIAASISGISGLNATVNSTTGTLNISATNGSQFDFTGNLESSPNLSAWTGTSAPTLSGNYSGASNNEYRFEVSGDGKVGFTDGLKANVFNKAGNLIATVDLGSKYEAGKPVDIGNGVLVAFGSGTVVDGEDFSSSLVANSDSGGLLSALGLNSFFEGSTANDIAVGKRILEKPSLFATGLTADSADSGNLKKILSALSSPMVNGQIGTEYLTEMSVAAGSRVQVGNSLESQLQSIKTRFESERDSHSGVDLNEELVNLTRYQQSYEATLRVLQTMDQMYDETLRMLG